MIADFDDVLDFVKQKHREAKDGSAEIVFPVEKFSESANNRGFAMGDLECRAPSITDLPQYAVLKHSKGLSAWAVILSVDLRHSSRLAIDLGAEKMYLTMHTFLPTMAHLVEKADGKVVGLRGDGLFAAFGVTELKGSAQVVTSDVASAAVKPAAHCGKAMIEAMEDAVNVVLRDEEIGDELQIGVGVDVGNVVITRIGLESASEVTAYGPPVNRACKTFASFGCNEVRISKSAYDMFPTSKGGRLAFNSFDGGYIVEYPTDLRMLSGGTNRRRSAK